MTRQLTLIALIAISLSSPIRAAEKRVVFQERMIVSPDQIEDLWDRSTAVVRVKISSLAVRGLPNVTAVPDVYTEYRADVIQTYRGEPARSIRFLHRAGQLDVGNVVVAVPHSAQLTVGSEYVVFLRFIDHYGAFVLTADREGAFRVERSAIVPEGRTWLAIQHRAMPIERFEGELRAFAKSRPQLEVNP